MLRLLFLSHLSIFNLGILRCMVSVMFIGRQLRCDLVVMIELRCRREIRLLSVGILFWSLLSEMK